MPEAWQTERAVWDEHAADEFDPDTLREAKDLWEPIHLSILEPLQPIRDSRVLDCGCGVGLLARVAANDGARVTGFDVSGGSISAGKRLFTDHPANLDYVTSIFESLPFEDQAFDAAIGQFILHHVDLAPAVRELARVLRPGANISFLETWQQNPLIRLGRRMRGKMGIAMYGTEDESPLALANLKVFEEAGFEIKVEFPVFILFRLINHNLFKGRKLFSPLARLLEGLDRLIGSIRPLRRFGYYALLVGTRQGTPK